MVRINILGGSGSGTSTSGRALASALEIPCFESDDYYHAASEPPFQNPRPPQARYDMITSDLRTDASWVLAGGIAGWEPLPTLGFTLVVFLWVPADIRIPRLRQRERDRFGSRILAGGDMFEAHESFIEWAARYDAGDVDGKSLTKHEHFLAQSACPVLEFRGPVTVDHIVAAVLDAT